MHSVMHVHTVNSLLVAYVGDSWDKAYDDFDDTGLKLLAIHSSRGHPVAKYVNSYAEGNLDALLELESDWKK